MIADPRLLDALQVEEYQSITSTVSHPRPPRLSAAELLDVGDGGPSLSWSDDQVAFRGVFQQLKGGEFTFKFTMTDPFRYRGVYRFDIPLKNNIKFASRKSGTDKLAAEAR